MKKSLPLSLLVAMLITISTLTPISYAANNVAKVSQQKHPLNAQYYFIGYNSAKGFQTSQDKTKINATLFLKGFTDAHNKVPLSKDMQTILYVYKHKYKPKQLTTSIKAKITKDNMSYILGYTMYSDLRYNIAKHPFSNSQFHSIVAGFSDRMQHKKVPAALQQKVQEIEQTGKLSDYDLGYKAGLSLRKKYDISGFNVDAYVTGFAAKWNNQPIPADKKKEIMALVKKHLNSPNGMNVGVFQNMDTLSYAIGYADATLVVNSDPNSRKAFKIKPFLQGIHDSMSGKKPADRQ